MRNILFFLLFFTAALVKAETTLAIYPNKPVPFSDFRGKWVLINYWASWCDICLKEIPALNQFYEKYKQDNVVLFALNYDMLPEEQNNFLSQQYHIRYPILTKDPANDLSLGEIRGVPVTFLFNPEGKLVDALYGEQNERSLRNAIAKATNKEY